MIFFELVAIEEVIELLEREYGPRKWQPDRDPIDVLIGTILSKIPRMQTREELLLLLRLTLITGKLWHRLQQSMSLRSLNLGDYPKSRQLESSRYLNKLKGNRAISA